MKKGFTKVVTELIETKPGLRGTDYAKMALKKGRAKSDAKDPVQSLAVTLRNEVAQGRLPGIVARKVDGSVRYYSEITRHEGATVSVTVSPDVAETLDMLIEVGKFRDRSEALSWLTLEGIAFKRDELQKYRHVRDEITRLKKSVA